MIKFISENKMILSLPEECDWNGNYEDGMSYNDNEKMWIFLSKNIIWSGCSKSTTIGVVLRRVSW